MEQDRYARELERAIFNWYSAGEHASPMPIFNALQAGLKHDMELLAAVKTPEAELRHLAVGEQGKYCITVFTSEAEMNKGGPESAVSQSLKSLLDMVELQPDCTGIVINLWGKMLELGRDKIKLVTSYKEKSHLTFVRGSVVDMHVGAIVNAANSSLLGGGGVDGAIHRAAGPGLLKECRLLHGCNTGEAKITGAYNISHADYIIHTVGPVYSGKRQDAELLADCYRNSLDLALANGCMSIAFPCISTGAYGYPLEEAARISLLAAVRWLDRHPDNVMNIYFCCFKEAELEMYAGLTG